MCLCMRRIKTHMKCRAHFPSHLIRPIRASFLKLPLIHKVAYFHFLAAAHLADALLHAIPASPSTRWLKAPRRFPAKSARQGSSPDEDCVGEGVWVGIVTALKNTFCILYIAWSHIWKVISVISLGPIRVILKMLSQNHDAECNIWMNKQANEQKQPITFPWIITVL